MFDELLEMSRKMKERLDQVTDDHVGVVNRLTRAVGEIKEVINAAGEVVKVR